MYILYRWNSSYDMLERYIKVYPELQKCEEFSELLVDMEDIILLNKLMRFLKPFKTITKVIYIYIYIYISIKY